MDGGTIKGVAALLWPIVTAWAIFLFRIEIRSLISRLRRFGKGGAEFSESRIGVQAISIPIEKVLKDVAPGERQDSYILKGVEELRAALNRLQPEDVNARESLLLLRLTQRITERDWAIFWLNIFASQRSALEAMAIETSAIDLTKFYDAHVEAYEAYVKTQDSPSPVGTFDAWARYLVVNKVAVINGRAGLITDLGLGFLAFAKQQNLPRFQWW